MTKQEIYDKMCKLLTDYEHPDSVVHYDDVEWEAELYEMLVEIQRHWECVITVQND